MRSELNFMWEGPRRPCIIVALPRSWKFVLQNVGGSEWGEGLGCKCKVREKDHVN